MYCTLLCKISVDVIFANEMSEAHDTFKQRRSVGTYELSKYANSRLSRRTVGIEFKRGGIKYGTELNSGTSCNWTVNNITSTRDTAAVYTLVCLRTRRP